MKYQLGVQVDSITRRSFPHTCYILQKIDDFVAPLPSHADSSPALNSPCGRYIYIFFIIIHVISLPIRALNVLFDLGFGLFSYHILNASCSNLSVSAFDHLLVLYCL